MPGPATVNPKGATMPKRPDPDSTPRFLRPAEAAAILQVSPKTVSRWAADGKLPYRRTLGGQRRYPEAEIQELADSLRFTPGSSQ